MPYKNPKQATAIFLSLQRRKGLAAAKAFGAKHREDFEGGGKGRSYRSRSARASDSSRSDAAQRGGRRPSRYNKYRAKYYLLSSGNNQPNKRS